MSTKRWNEAQRQAIEDEGGALLVSAAAGSGKTAVLVERAVRLITHGAEPVPADRLLILTFTNAAAEELRGRIALRLEAELRADPSNTALRRQRMLLHRAFIGTVDAFCIQLVREHFAALDLSPDIAVGERAQLDMLAAAALAEVMEAMYTDADFAAFAGLYGRSRSDKAAEEAVLALYGYTATLPNPAAALGRYAAMYADTAPPERTAWGAELVDYAATALGEAGELAAEALRTAAETEALAPCMEVLRADVEALARVRAALRDAGWDGAAAALDALGFGALRPRRAKEGQEDVRVAAVRRLRDTVKDIVADLKRYVFVCTAAEYESDRESARGMVGALCRAAANYREAYDAKKRAERILDFTDFEHLALRLLRDDEGNRTPLAERVSARYAAVMVDEYQDTNELQDALYTALAQPGGGNLFYVGDVKQSIYRFRRANPDLFLEKKRAWAPQATGRHPAHITLGHNYRSTPGVIGAVNWLFERLMSPALGEVDYGAGERLIPGAAEDATRDANAESAQPRGFTEPTPAFEMCAVAPGKAEDEAAFVAGRIAQLVAQGAPVGTGDAARPCNYGDFCILMRAGAKMPLFAAALQARGIPVSAAGGGALLQTPEVLPLTAALAAIDNLGDDVNLAAAMLGPLFRFTPGQLARLRAELPAGRLWAAVTAARDGKAEQFVRRMAEYRALAVTLPVGRLCEHLMDETGYLAAVAAMQGGAARRENVHRFIAWAAAATQNGRGGLAGFVRLCQNTDGPEAPGAKTLPGHVSLLTIHKSKGLEFPFVFLCDARHRFNLRELGDKVQLHTTLGVGIALRSGGTLYRTLPQAAIRSRLLRETQSEEMRLLYVALTRAKQRITVTFAAEDPARLLADKAAYQAACPGAFMLARQQSMADWLLSALVGHPCCDDALAAANLPLLPKAGAPDVLAFGVQPPAPADEAPEAAGPYRLTAAPDKALLAQLQTAFATVPRRAQLADVPAKVSVSAITKTEGPSILKRPSFMYTSGLTAAERGTAQHAFLQHADFAAAQANLEDEITRLAAAGYLGGEAASSLDRKGIRAFFASSLAGRIGAAGQVLREYDFITALPAGLLQPQLDAEYRDEPVLVQGIADLVLVNAADIEIVDYKTDRVENGEELARRYAAQLALYAAAVEKRLGLPVRRLTLWSFALNREVPLEE